jgi:hypothetical protein
MLALQLALAVLVGGGQDPARRASYRLPWEEGKNYMVTQGNNGSLSHGPGYNLYAWDFGLPEGSKVCAARDGKVVFASEDIVKGGTGGGNQIKIDHGDGTFGVYFHLKHQGALVEVGDVVLQGDLIGLSGATGNVTGPHLHFQVDKGGTSIPAKFDDVETDDGVPQNGKSYTSKNTPGIPSVTKDLLNALWKAARLAEAEGGYGTAYMAYKRFADEKLKVKYAPQEEARKKLDEIAARADETAKKREVAALFEARIAFEGVPTRAISEALEGLKTDPAYTEAKAKSWYWDHFYRGLKDEVEGRLPQARGHYKNIMSNKPSAEIARRTEPRLAAVEARLKDALQKKPEKAP